MTVKQQEGEREERGGGKEGAQRIRGSRRESRTLKKHTLKTTLHQREGELTPARTSQIPVPHCEARKEKTTEGQNLPLVQDETHPDIQMLITYHLKYDVLIQVSVSFFLGQGQFLC